MCKVKMMIKGEKKKRMKINKRINDLVTALKRERNVGEKAEVEARNLREEVDMFKGEIEEVRKEVSVSPKNKAER